MIKTVGIICKWERPEPREILKDLLPWLAKQEVETYCDPSETCCQDNKPISCGAEEMSGKVDMAMVLGGDGTMLWAARLFSASNVPLLGVNLGGMGYLTEVASSDLVATMKQVLSGKYSLEKRIMLTAHHKREGKTLTTIDALNDVVVNKAARATIIKLEVFVDDIFITRYSADGLIVSTPTGSTGYSLSAGGPILYPTLNSLLLTPICPHTLTNRPIVLPGNAKVDIRLVSRSKDVILTYDGLVSDTLAKGDTISINRSSHVTTLIMPHGHDHFETLRTKLRWGEH